MAIEVPGEANAVPEDDHFDSIGQFYKAIEIAFEELSKSHDLFKDCQREKQLGDPKFYATVGYNDEDTGTLHFVDDVESALKAMHIIIRQGEGVRDEHYADDSRKEVNHYYKFEQVMKDAQNKPPEVWPLAKNPRAAQMAPLPRELATLFNACYSFSLATMEEAFATPEGAHKDALMERVYFAMKEAMPLVARELVKLPMTDGAAEHAGPPFGRYSFKAGKDIGAQVLDLVKAVESDFPPVSRLHEIEKMVKSRATGLEVPTILPTFNGPYNVTGMREMLNSRGEALDAKVSMNLCRCGGSANKPFCDMTHVRIGFRDTNELGSRCESEGRLRSRGHNDS